MLKQIHCLLFELMVFTLFYRTLHGLWCSWFTEPHTVYSCCPSCILGNLLCISILLCSYQSHCSGWNWHCRWSHPLPMYKLRIIIHLRLSTIILFWTSYDTVGRKNTSGFIPTITIEFQRWVFNLLISYLMEKSYMVTTDMISFLPVVGLFCGPLFWQNTLSKQDGQWYDHVTQPISALSFRTNETLIFIQRT